MAAASRPCPCFEKAPPSHVAAGILSGKLGRNECRRTRVILSPLSPVHAHTHTHTQFNFKHAHNCSPKTKFCQQVAYRPQICSEFRVKRTGPWTGVAERKFFIENCHIVDGHGQTDLSEANGPETSGILVATCAANQPALNLPPNSQGCSAYTHPFPLAQPTTQLPAPARLTHPLLSQLSAQLHPYSAN